MTEYSIKPQGRPKRDANGLTDSQRNKIAMKRRYDEERYRRISNRLKWNSPEHHASVTKKGLAKRKAPGHCATTRLINRYRWNSSVKQVPFTLERSEVVALVTANCHYCGAEPSMQIVGEDIWSPLTYNGIDRIDNTLGYVKGNVVTCCRTCNIAKRDLAVQDFLAWAAKLYLHQHR